MQNKSKRITSVIIAICLVIALSATFSNQIAGNKFGVYAQGTTTWYISPTGIDDTDNIQFALDNAAPGDIIQLSAGQFYCTHIEVEDFHGTFKGAGQTATTIDVIPGGPVIYDYIPPYGCQWNYFFKFEDGDFTISDMHFDITPYHPANEWIWFFEVTTAVGDILFLTGDCVNAHIERVSFTAHDGTYNGRNVNDGIAFWSEIVIPEFEYVSGSLTVSNCSFENMDFSILCERVTDSDISISQNSMTNGFSGCGIAYAFNNQLAITHNQITNMDAYSIFLWEADDVVIADNEIDTSGLAYSAWSPILGSNSRNAKITRNHITGNYVYGVNPYAGSDGWTIEHNTFGQTKAGETLGISAAYGVIAIEGCHDCVAAYNKFYDVHDSFYAIYVWGNNNAILSNQIRGTSLFGLFVDESSTGCYLRGNNLDNFNALYADICLWYGTNDNTVVVGAANSIIDLGINNVIGYEDE
ncbi:MAG: right-handed parallel beta-helix repeat-containing protein [Candidatus Hodarchaeota archaeon]